MSGSYTVPMVDLTPWEAKRRRSEPASSDPPQAETEPRRPALRASIPKLPLPRGNWRYRWHSLGAAASSLITFALLFRPWMRAHGWDGGAEVNAFGHIKATTQYLNTWSQSSPPLAHISGVWAILITVAVVLCVTAAIANVRNPSRAVSTLVTASMVAIAGLVVAELLYFNSKEAALKAMLGFSGDLGAQIGLLVRGLMHPDTYPVPGRSSPYATAELTSWAIVTCALSLSSAVLTVLHWARGRSAKRSG